MSSRAAGAALASLFEGWKGRRVAEVRALLAAGVAVGDVGAAMVPPASSSAAAGYVALAMSHDSPGRGDGGSDSVGPGLGGSHPVPAAREAIRAPLSFSPCEW